MSKTQSQKIKPITHLLLFSLLVILSIQQDIPHCKEYNQEKTTCLQCEDSYYLKSPTECSECLPHCLKCLNSSTCSDCKFGFYQQNNDCFACSNLCRTCEDFSKCTSCNSGKVLRNSKCEEKGFQTFTLFVIGISAVIVIAVVFIIINIVKRAREKGDDRRDSVIYDENGNPRFGNIPYKYSHRKRGLTVGEQYVKAGGTQNPSAVQRPSFVPGRESYKTMERTTFGDKKRGYGADESGDLPDDVLV